MLLIMRIKEKINLKVVVRIIDKRKIIKNDFKKIIRKKRIFRNALSK